MVRSRGIPVHLETMQPGDAYCVKVRTFVKAIGRHSPFSQAECVKVQGMDGFPVPGVLPAQMKALPGVCLAIFWVPLVLSLL